jgi:hypothetical protein
VSQVATIKGGKSWLVNPGTVGGVGAPPTYIMADLAAMLFEIVTIEAAPASVLPPVTPHV